MSKLFVIVDQSLSKRQQFVQGAHAVAQHLVDFPNSPWKNKSLVMLKTKDLQHYIKLLSKRDINFSHFVEPYYNGMTTSLSALNIENLVASLKLI